MAWRRRRPYDRRALLASGALLGEGPGPGRSTAERAQAHVSEAWSYYDRVGELHYVANLRGSMLSRVTLHPVVRNDRGEWVRGVDDDGTPVSAEAEVVRSALDMLEPHSELLRTMGILDMIEGESRLVGRPGEGPWEAMSSAEIVWTGDRWQRVASGGRVELPAGEEVARIWRPHPRNRALADSPIRASLDVLRQMVLLSDAVSAACSSRALLGILRYPAELDAMVPKGAPVSDDDAHPFQSLLIDVASRAIQEPDAPSRWVPLALPMPAELPKDALDFLSFAQNFTDFPVQELIEEAVVRFARGIDWPVEVVLGHQSTTFANAREIAMSLVRDHVEPVMELFDAGLTEAITNPALIEAGLDPWSAVVGHSTAELQISPDIKTLVPSLVKAGVISAAAARDRLGFDDDAAPAPDDAEGVVSLESTAEVVQMIQQIYLGVGRVLSSDEARELLNRAGAGLTDAFTPDPPASARAAVEAMLGVNGNGTDVRPTRRTK